MPAGVTFRVASGSDAASLAAMHLACWREAYAGLVPQSYLDEMAAQDRVAEWQRRLARAQDSTTVALQGDQVVGLATVGPLADEAAELPAEELRALYVLGTLQGAGIGQALLHRALGDRPACLWTFAEMHRTRRFYALAGWLPTGERRVDPSIGALEIRLVRRAVGLGG